MKGSKFFNPRRTNPLVVDKKFEKLEERVELHGKNIDALSKSHDNHISMLANFARHDIKNSVQSMDSILSTNSVEELNEEKINSLKLNLNIIRETIDNFSKLVPYNQNSYFILEELITAIELLNRESFYVNEVSFSKDIPDLTFKFHLPFQSVLQMSNNIIINAIKSFGEQNIKKIKIQAIKNDDTFSLRIYDNGNPVKFKNKESIFEYGISSTGGSGIGLFHARYLCELYKGKIELVELVNNEFTKFFLIDLPIITE